MTTNLMIVAYARQLLTGLTARVLARVPSALGNVSDNVVRGNVLVCSSFMSTRSANTVDLCIEIEVAEVANTVSADLVRGGSGEIISEMTPVTVIRDGVQTQVLGALDQYVRDMEDKIVALLIPSIQQ